MTANWMRCNKKENPLYEQYDRLLEIAHRYDMVLSLGDGLRPGAIDDATDQAQLQELIILGQLAARARAAGVQVMIEGPGHVPLTEIEAISNCKEICQGAPFLVLGPLPTDIAPGYDHITSAIGGAIAGAAGADFLCYVTPAEQFASADTRRCPRRRYRRAHRRAHCRYCQRTTRRPPQKTEKWHQCRNNFDWQGQVDFQSIRKNSLASGKSKSAHDEGCTMCGEFCAIKLGKR